MTDQTPPNPEVTTPNGATTEIPILVWATHPAKARPLVTALVIVFLIVLVVTVYLLTYFGDILL